MEKAIFDNIGKISVFVAYIVNFAEWQIINIIFTCVLTILSCVYIIFKIYSLQIDNKIKKENKIIEKMPTTARQQERATEKNRSS